MKKGDLEMKEKPVVQERGWGSPSPLWASVSPGAPGNHAGIGVRETKPLAGARVSPLRTSPSVPFSGHRATTQATMAPAPPPAPSSCKKWRLSRMTGSQAQGGRRLGKGRPGA